MASAKSASRSRRDSKGSQHSQSSTNLSGTNSTVKYADECFHHEPFETFQHKVIRLCRDIGFGNPDEVIRMKGGSYNRVVGLKFLSRLPTDYVLRIPRTGIAGDKSQDIKDQVALLHFLSQCEGVPVASIAAFDSTRENAIACSYVLQERVAGTDIDSAYYNLPMAEKLQVVTKVADLILKMEAVSLERPGRLVAQKTLAARSFVPLAKGPHFEITNYRNFDDAEPFLSQPLPLLLRSMFEHQKNRLFGSRDEYTQYKWIKLQQITDQMVDAGLFRFTDSNCMLWHWDFAGRNVMINQTTVQQDEVQSPTQSCQHKFQVELDSSTCNAAHHSVSVTLVEDDCNHNIQFSIDGNTGKTHQSKSEWEVTGVLDWDDVISVPRILARKPPVWLWFNEDNRNAAWSGDNDIPPLDLTHDQLLIKAYFDRIMARADPTYIDDAYNRGVWIRRLARFAFHGIVSDDDRERYDVFVKEWKEFYANIRPGLITDDDDDGHDPESHAREEAGVEERVENKDETRKQELESEGVKDDAA